MSTNNTVLSVIDSLNDARFVSVLKESSRDGADLLLANAYGYWEHTRRAKDLEDGGYVVITTTKSSLTNRDRENSLVLVGKVSSQESVITDGSDWTVQITYRHRYYFSDVELVPFNKLPSFIKDKANTNTSSSVLYAVNPVY